MMLLSGAMVLLSATAVTTVPAHVPSPTIRGGHNTPQVVSYTSGQMEAYFSEEQTEYIRPGFKITLVALTNVGPGKKPVAEITYTDDMDQPLDYLGKVTPGPLSISFILAWYDPVARQYKTGDAGDFVHLYRNRSHIFGNAQG